MVIPASSLMVLLAPRLRRACAAQVHAHALGVGSVTSEINIAISLVMIHQL